MTVGNIALPLFPRVSPTQNVAIIPGLRRRLPLVVRNPGGVSNRFTANIQTFAPAIFARWAGGRTGLATVIGREDNDFVDFTNPIHPDDVLTIYVTRSQPDVAGGLFQRRTPSDPLAAAATAAITLGGNLPRSGRVPSEVAVYFINVLVPHAG